MSADTIYLVVQESGAYSDWQKDNVAFFWTHDDAAQYIRQLELADIYHRTIGKYSYFIEEIFLGQL